MVRRVHMAFQGRAEHPGISFRHALFQPELINQRAAQNVHAAGIALSGGKAGPGKGFRVAGLLAPVAEQHQISQIGLADGISFPCLAAEGGYQGFPLFRRDVLRNAFQRNEISGGGFGQAVVQQSCPRLRSRFFQQVGVFHLGQAQFGKGVAFLRRHLVPRAHVLLRFMGLSHGIHRIG